MISLQELCPQGFEKFSDDVHSHLLRLHFVLNFFRRLDTTPWKINRGVSTPDEQEAIYEKINQKRMQAGQAPIPVPMGSCHLLGAAADIADPDGRLKRFFLDRLELIESMHVFFEHFDYSTTWVHLQILPYPSWEPGKSHFFIPY